MSAVLDAPMELRQTEWREVCKISREVVLFQGWALMAMAAIHIDDAERGKHKPISDGNGRTRRSND